MKKIINSFARWFCKLCSIFFPYHAILWVLICKNINSLSLTVSVITHSAEQEALFCLSPTLSLSTLSLKHINSKLPSTIIASWLCREDQSPQWTTIPLFCDRSGHNRLVFVTATEEVGVLVFNFDKIYAVCIYIHTP